MLDFLTPSGFILNLAAQVWMALSVGALSLAGLGGLLVAAGVLLPMWAPGMLRRVLLIGGGTILVGALGWQTAIAEGVRIAQAAQLQLALEAEKTRTAAAEEIVTADRAKAARDLAAARAAASRLKDLLDAAQKRQDAARVCLPRDLSRRLRDL